MNESELNAFVAYIADPESDLPTIFAVERAYEVDMEDVDQGWLP
ncbi:hypothetical protein [Streptomyces sp. MBT42]|nr:hypothetical protein [Streptomyces sp. MBT42]